MNMKWPGNPQSESNLSWVQEQAKSFLQKQIDEKNFVVDVSKLPNRRVREYLSNNDYLYSPTKGLYIIKSRDTTPTQVVEQNYFHIISKMTKAGVVSGQAALNYHLGNNSKLPVVDIYHPSKDTSLSFKGENDYTVRISRSKKYREVEPGNIQWAKLIIETPLSYLINNYSSDTIEDKNYQMLAQNTHFMIGDIKRFIDKGASVSSLSSLAHFYNAQGDARNYWVIKAAVVQSWKNFRYENNQEQALWVLDDLNFNVVPDEEVKSPKLKRFEAFMDDLSKSSLRYLEERDVSHIPLRDIDSLMESIDHNIVHDSYHSLTIENYNVTPEDIEILKDENSTDEDIQQVEERLSIKWYFDAFRITKNQIKQDAKGDGKINKEFIQEINWALFSHYATARWFTQENWFRKSNVEITQSKHLPPDHSIVPDFMDSYISHVNNIDTSTTAWKIHKAVIAHYFLAYIHPFKDGNGRSARFLMNHALGSNSLDWVTILADNREQYIGSLRMASDNWNIVPFTEFITSCLEETAKNQD